MIGTQHEHRQTSDRSCGLVGSRVVRLLGILPTPCGGDMTTARMRLRPEQADSWQAKVIEETGGRSRPLGCVVIAALDYNRKGKYPAMSAKGYIDINGVVMALYKPNRFVDPMPFRVGTTETFTGDLRRVADQCKLNDADRVAFFDKMRGWVVKDERVTPVTGELRGPDGKQIS